MKTYHFELVLSTPTTEDDDERLLEVFEGCSSSAVVNGTPLLYLHMDAESMDDAVSNAIAGTRELGISVRRIELDPEMFLAEAARLEHSDNGRGRRTSLWSSVFP